MGFGAVVTVGDSFDLMTDPLFGSLVEIRVEMDLSEPTKFALRFEDDICDGDSKIVAAQELRGNARVAIFVPFDGSYLCLVSGRVTEIKSSSTLGGSGSWVEVHGVDRRIEMDRVTVEAKWEGSADQAAMAIIEAYDFEAEVQETLIRYDSADNTLNQNSTDLAFLQEIARRNNMELWFEYKVSTAPSLLGGVEIKNVNETLRLETSPLRNQKSAPGLAPSFPALFPEPEKVFRVNPSRGQCATVNQFRTEIDFEKPTAARGFDNSRAESERLVEQIALPQDPLGERTAPDKIAGAITRELKAPEAPTPERAQLLRDALVYEESWFVMAQGSTTIRLAEFVPLPHQSVDVTNNGTALSGAYQIATATHVITANEHYVDFTARANGLVGI